MANGNNKLRAYFDAHIAPVLTTYEHGEFKLSRIPVGMNDRRMADLREMLNVRFGEQSHSNGRRGGITVCKDSRRGVIAIDLNGVDHTARIKHDRKNRSRMKAVH